MELLADDKKVEKKNRTLLEPVQFYVADARIPHEIVVNKIEKNRNRGMHFTPDYPTSCGWPVRLPRRCWTISE